MRRTSYWYLKALERKERAALVLKLLTTGEKTRKDIALLIGVDSGGVTSAVLSLIKEGRIQETEPIDNIESGRAAMLLKLTEKGRLLIEGAIKEAPAHI